MQAYSGGQTPKTQNFLRLQRQSLPDHLPDNKDDTAVADDDDDHLCFEDGPALRQEWDGLEQHHTDQPRLTKVSLEMRYQESSEIIQNLTGQGFIWK